MIKGKQPATDSHSNPVFAQQSFSTHEKIQSASYIYISTIRPKMSIYVVNEIKSTNEIQ